MNIPSVTRCVAPSVIFKWRFYGDTLLIISIATINIVFLIYLCSSILYFKVMFHFIKPDGFSPLQLFRIIESLLQF
jgi:hypothetical protein